MTYHDLQRQLHDQPFKPFKIKLINGTVYEIREPWMVMIGESSAVIVTQVRKDDRGYNLAEDWRTVSISHMAEFIDVNGQSAGSKRKRAS